MINQQAACIHLKFIRHAEKKRDALTKKGEEQASGLKLSGTIAYASDTVRTKSTAALATSIDGIGPKVRVLKNLGYSGNRDFSDKAMEAGSNGEISMFIIDSDKYFKNEEDSTYTKVAGDFAEIILKYCKIRDRVSGKLPEIQKEFNRLFVSHQGVLELIMFKLIEKNGRSKGPEKYEGREGLEKFINENHLEGGVNFCEGIDIYIFENSIKLKFRNQEFSMDEKFLEGLINDRNEMYTKNKRENNTTNF